MADYVFKNLSVKVMPAGDDGEKLPPECEPCTQLCTGCTADLSCDDCTNCSFTPTCTVCTCIADSDIPIISKPEFDEERAGDLRAELEAHRVHLRLALMKTEEALRKPQSVDEVDALRAQLEGALAELEQRRSELEARRTSRGDE